MSRQKSQPKVALRASWGNDDAESTIKISAREWKKIQDGEEFERNGWGWYEGKRFSVGWRFKDRKVTIAADDRECIIEDPLENLYVD